jgi:hypothetical protein
LAIHFEQLLPQAVHAGTHSHRVPLGLLMLSQGLISHEQLRTALQEQRKSGGQRIGNWLCRLGAVTEQQVTRALGIQWSLPIFPLDKDSHYLECAQLVPFPLLESSCMLPVHFLPASRHLYMAFAEHVDHTALYAVEQMLDCNTEPCLAPQSSIQKALEQIRHQPRPDEVLFDSVCESRAMAHATRSYALKLAADEVRVVRLWSAQSTTSLLFQAQEARIGPEVSSGWEL